MSIFHIVGVANNGREDELGLQLFYSVVENGYFCNVKDVAVPAPRLAGISSASLRFAAQNGYATQRRANLKQSNPMPGNLRLREKSS